MRTKLLGPTTSASNVLTLPAEMSTGYRFILVSRVPNEGTHGNPLRKGGYTKVDKFSCQ